MLGNITIIQKNKTCYKNSSYFMVLIVHIRLKNMIKRELTNIGYS